MMIAAIPALPFWMKQRQVQAEQVSEDTMLLKAPQLPVYEVAVRPAADEPGWTATLYYVPPEGGDKLRIAESPYPLDNLRDAWEAAYELYREHVIV